MSAIATYVFIDLETTGLPQEENNRTKITELSFVAVKRQHVLDTRQGCAPRVQQKLTLCLNPGRMVQPEGTKVTGLCNELLEHEPFFNKEVFTVINTFLNLFTKPVCLIAQNGHNFDFPILKNHFNKLSVSLADDLMCADCLHGFFDIMEKRKLNDTSTTVVDSTKEKNTVSNENKTQIDEIDFLSDNTLRAQAVNEMTPKQSVIACVNKTPKKTNSTLAISKARRRFPWSKGEKPNEKYKLKDIYYRLLNREAVDAHHAENDCLLALECSVALGEAFVQWIDENHCLFSEVKPMTVGTPLGR
ncbi:three-prime repair exonuclease 1-like [Maniola hyperantus]|uniref:three-prime repair exonuclease 1-like n=1 Tax=Aphantopus hyperantus TaxID=2795564 RepID=UPI0015697C8C|nr:three-prime repair exonuclease 1-like [Maniola hyperantus]